jgi:hypothetical protein
MFIVMVDLTILSVVQMNVINDLGEMWKEAVVVQFVVLS